MKKIRVLLALILLSFILLNINVNSAFVLKNTSGLINAYNNTNLIRLHVIANSNSLKDQYIKRMVRDETMKYIARYPEARLNLVKNNLVGIENYIKNILRREGVNYQVNVEYGKFYFPKRTYNDMTLPSGEYKALKIILGKGEGANWWCVLLPPVCIKDVDNRSSSKDFVFKKKNIEFKFKLLEIIKEKDYRKNIEDIDLLKLLRYKINLVTNYKYNRAEIIN